jgi:hypothetical protein
VLAQLAARFGGQPEQYGEIVDTLFLLCHGTSAMLTAGGDLATRKALREACIKICDRLIEHVEIFQSGD